jgi:Protein of unknown function (DUF3551)
MWFGERRAFMAGCSSWVSRWLSPPSPKYIAKKDNPCGQSWGTFLRNHLPHTAALPLEDDPRPHISLSGSGFFVEDSMRTLALTTILIATLGLGTEAASAAPWCTEYGGGRSGGSNCGFYSFEQCMANAWGNGSFCRRNAFEDPYWTGRGYRRSRR